MNMLLAVQGEDNGMLGGMHHGHLACPTQDSDPLDLTVLAVAHRFPVSARRYRWAAS